MNDLPGAASVGAGERPNILLIMADQMAAHMMSNTGNPDISTPALDRLAAEGTRMDRAYVTFPLCVPARSSLLTGQYPHTLGLTSNDASGDALGPDSLGHLLSGGGYQCAYAGKWHATRPSAQAGDGFEPIKDFGDRGLTTAVDQFLTSGRDPNCPFFLVASFDDPHTICEYARNQPLYYGDTPTTELANTPNLPANFGHQPFEPEALRTEQHEHAKVYGTGGYTPEDWRHYRYTYARLVERVDARVGELLEILDRTGRARDTLVIFTSDHGDGDGSHSWNQKTALFEEIVRVPFLVRWPGRVPAGRVDSGTLVSVCLDLLPTLAQAAQARATAGLPGRSLLPVLCDGERLDRERLVVQTSFPAVTAPATRGRAVVEHRYKYVLYSWGRYREQLHDLQSDPGEMTNLAVESRYQGELDRLRGELLRWARSGGDEEMLTRLVLPQDTDEVAREEIYVRPY
ncbi:sulfatase [Pseudactinotalea sp. Z1739]|uniref:sulfatase family protein n=1 Tax=Pseudactinotalea sp. Z1739 TaxID=3413028 RepID=UPI003C7A3C9D